MMLCESWDWGGHLPKFSLDLEPNLNTYDLKMMDPWFVSLSFDIGSNVFYLTYIRVRFNTVWVAS